MKPNARQENQEGRDRARRLRAMMNEYIRNMTDAERDRLMQVHLAEARGIQMNAYLLRKAMDFAIRMRAASHRKDTAND